MDIASAASSSSEEETTTSSWSTIASNATSTLVPSSSAAMHPQQRLPPVSPKDPYARRTSSLLPRQSPPFAKPAAMGSLDLEDPAAMIQTTPSWAQRIPWLGKHHKRRKRRLMRNEEATSAVASAPVLQSQLLDSLDYTAGEAVYHRYEHHHPSTTHSAVAPRIGTIAHPSTLIDNNNNHLPQPTSNWQRVASWITSLSHEQQEDDDDPLHRHLEDDPDMQMFSEADWTPPDSSYGAAIPVGGCIPKNIRRLIEWTILAGLFLGVVMFLIATSIRLHSEGDSNGSAVTNNNGADANMNYYYALNATNAAVTDEYSDEYGNGSYDENSGSSSSSSYSYSSNSAYNNDDS